MKNLIVCLIVFALCVGFVTIPVFADDLPSLEIAKVFADKGFQVSDGGELEVWVTTITKNRERCYRIYRYSRRIDCYPDPERVVYVTVKDGSGKTIAVGSGNDRDVQDAAKKAAESAAEKTLKKFGGRQGIAVEIY